MSEFFQLRVNNVIRETDDTISITFDIPAELKEVFSYKAGQFVSIKTELEGQTQSRAYSIASSPDVDDELTVTVKEIEDGFVSKFLNRNVTTGDNLYVMKPRGKFVADVMPGKKRTQIMFAAGSGITPIFSMLKTILEIEKQSNVVLVYLNRNKNKIIYLSLIDELITKYSNRLSVIHYLTQEHSDFQHNKGRLDKEKVLNLLRDYSNDKSIETHYYMCGPKEMMNAILEALNEFGVDKSFIHKESFNSGKSGGECKPALIQPMIPVKKDFKEVKVVLYNEQHTVAVKKDESILEAVMRDGYDPPFSCQIGACASCRAKLVTGEVEMDERDALTDDEIKQGYILTCQSHPKTENVFINFDDQY